MRELNKVLNLISADVAWGISCVRVLSPAAFAVLLKIHAVLSDL